MQTRLAAGTTAFKEGVAALKANPRRAELLKPVLMIAVNIIAYTMIIDIIKSEMPSTYPNPYASASWGLLAAGFAMGTAMPTILYLAEVYDNITAGKTTKNFKRGATYAHIVMFIITLAMILWSVLPTANPSETAVATATFIGMSAVMATMVVMGAVDNRLIKNRESRHAAGVEMDERVRLQLEKERQGIN